MRLSLQPVDGFVQYCLDADNYAVSRLRTPLGVEVVAQRNNLWIKDAGCVDFYKSFVPSAWTMRICEGRMSYKDAHIWAERIDDTTLYFAVKAMGRQRLFGVSGLSVDTEHVQRLQAFVDSLFADRFLHERPDLLQAERPRLTVLPGGRREH